MDNEALQNWSDTLLKLREARQTWLRKKLEEKGSAFSVNEFFDQAIESLDQITERWIAEEQRSIELNPPDDPAVALNSIRTEADSVIDFEIEAIQRDFGVLRVHANWTEEAVSDAKLKFDDIVAEIRNKYQIKLNSLAAGLKKKAPPSPVTGTSSSSVQLRYSSTSGGFGTGMAMMFVIGLVLGGGPSVYFWDAAKKTEKRYETEKSRLLTHQRLMEDNLAILHDIFDQLATGRMKNLRGIEEEIRGIKLESAKRKKRDEQDHAAERERLIKRIPAGDRLDRALEELEYQRVQKEGALRDQERLDLEKLEKQRKMINDLRTQ